LYYVWTRLFLCYYATPEQVEGMFNLRAPRFNLPRHRVVHFRDREQYVKSLGRMMPNIETSEGFYTNRTQTAYFFGDGNANEETLLHEATHQLFHESRPVADDVGESANYWAVEGMAVYMETLRREGDYHVLGGFDVPRMIMARRRVLKDGFYIPFDTLTRYGVAQIQNDPNVRPIYSQIAGWTQFLIYYDQGRYRDALVQYVMEVYNGSQDPTLLSRLTRTSYADLDRQYREFMKNPK
jgi:hypothetical protein